MRSNPLQSFANLNESFQLSDPSHISVSIETGHLGRTRTTSMQGRRHSEEHLSRVFSNGKQDKYGGVVPEQGSASRPTNRGKAQYGGTNSEAKRLKQLQDEDRKLEDVLSKPSSACGTLGSRELCHDRVPDEQRHSCTLLRLASSTHRYWARKVERDIPR